VQESNCASMRRRGFPYGGGYEKKGRKERGCRWLLGSAGCQKGFVGKGSGSGGRGGEGGGIQREIQGGKKRKKDKTREGAKAQFQKENLSGFNADGGETTGGERLWLSEGATTTQSIRSGGKEEGGFWKTIQKEEEYLDRGE